MLAKMIDDALRLGQRGDGTLRTQCTEWTNVAFADKAKTAESVVRSWRDVENPTRPKNIIPVLNAFFGTIEQYAAARLAMQNAWRRAGGFEVEEPPPALRAIVAEEFSEVAEIIDLSVSQPTPDNTGGMKVGFTFRVHPDPECFVAGETVEIGVTTAFLFVESDHWKPDSDSVFRRKDHPNIKPGAASGGVQITGPKEAAPQGRIDGAPLGDVAEVRFEKGAKPGDGPIGFSVRVPRNGFVVTPCDTAAPVTRTQATVLDALFGDAFPKDKKERLIVARDTVGRPIGSGSKCP